MDLIGKRFGKITVIDYAEPKGKKKNKAWLCKCDCGTERVVLHYNLVGGKSKSCGCVRGVKIGALMRTHGQSGTHLYSIWKGMKQRCNNEHNPAYRHYGGRGIKILPSWDKDFMSFKRWADKNGYKDGLSIDRIDPNRGYSPDNCRWVTMEKQQNNKRNSFFLNINGNKMTVAEVAGAGKIKKTGLYYRLYKVLELLNIPDGVHVNINIDYD